MQGYSTCILYLINNDVSPEANEALQSRMKVIKWEICYVLTNIPTCPNTTTYKVYKCKNHSTE